MLSLMLKAQCDLNLSKESLGEFNRIDHEYFDEKKGDERERRSKRT